MLEFVQLRPFILQQFCSNLCRNLCRCLCRNLCSCALNYQAFFAAASVHLMGIAMELKLHKKRYYTKQKRNCIKKELHKTLH